MRELSGTTRNAVSVARGRFLRADRALDTHKHDPQVFEEFVVAQTRYQAALGFARQELEVVEPTREDLGLDPAPALG